MCMCKQQQYDLMSRSLGSETVQIMLILHNSLANVSVSGYQYIWHRSSRYICKV